MGLWKKCGGEMAKQISTDIKPIDALFKAIGEKGIPLSSVIAVAQEDFDDATRYILLNLIDNFLQRNYICIYITYNKAYTGKIFNEFDKKINNRNQLINCIDYLEKNDQLKVRSDVFLRIMDADFMDRKNSDRNVLKKFKRFKEYMDEKKLNVIESTNLSETIRFYKNIYKNYPKDKIIVFDNSSWLLESEKEPSARFFELCRSIDKYTIVFHFFTLNMHDDKTQGKIGDAVDGYIHLKSMKKNIFRPLRSVGIKKMIEVRESSEYNAYKIDEYGIVKELK